MSPAADYDVAADLNASTATASMSPSPCGSCSSTPSAIPPDVVVWDHIENEARVTWYIYALGCGGGLLVVLAVLAVLHHRGLLFGRSKLRRPSHAQPWRHWGSPRSRLPSLFDLLHVPGTKSRKSSSALDLESGLPPPAYQPGPLLQVPVEVLGPLPASAPSYPANGLTAAAGAAGGAEESPYTISGGHRTPAHLSHLADPELHLGTVPEEPPYTASGCHHTPVHLPHPADPELHLGAVAEEPPYTVSGGGHHTSAHLPHLADPELHLGAVAEEPPYTVSGGGLHTPAHLPHLADPELHLGTAAEASTLPK